MSNYREVLNHSVVPCFVAKIDNNLIPDLEGWYPILLDCFLLNSKTAERFASTYKEETVTPNLGSKFIGAYRDKGSITGMLKRYIPVCKYQLNNEQEVKNFTNLLSKMNKDYKIAGNTVIFEIDIVAECSYGRDNVSSLLLQSCFDLKANITGQNIEMSRDELNALNVEEVLAERQYDHEVIIIDTHDNNKEVLSFGKVAILLEDFFFQPSHDNKLCAGIKEVAFSYHQCRDAFAVLTPKLHQIYMNSINKSAIKEAMICTGIEVQQIDDSIPDKVQVTMEDIATMEDDLI